MPWPYAKGYCQVTDVAALDQQVPVGGYTTTTRPTLAQVEQWITDCSQLTDSALLNMGRTAPIDAAELVDLAVARQWVAIGAAGKAGLSKMNAYDPTLKSQGAHYWSDFLRWLRQPTFIGGDVGSAGLLAAVSSGLTNPDPVTGEAKAPAFSTSMRF